jgi:Zn-dependent protease with chaperone function
MQTPEEKQRTEDDERKRSAGGQNRAEVQAQRKFGVVPLVLALVILSGSRFASGQERQEQVLFSGAVQVAAGKRFLRSFTTQTNFKNARIAGSVQAQGGSGNDIRVLVAKGQSLIYDSGRRRSVVISVDFSEPGQYVLMFDNTFSLVSPKIVTGTISLVHWGVDEVRNATEQQIAIAHYRQATAIIQRLYAVLKGDEQILGTSQLLGVPTIRLNNEDSINAAANWATNSITVNRGLFRLTDKAGDKGDEVLAATLSHEMSHIFYRHPGYGSTSGQGVKGLFDELRGVTALDRIQEKEADILGIRVACQAGFDPQGMLILMRLFAQLDGGASSFMQNHPSSIERVNYLQVEVARCEQVRSQERPPKRPQTNVATTTQPPSYAASLDIGASTESATMRAWSIDELEPAGDYIQYFFNRPHDIVWAQCQKGYITKSAESPTDNHLLREDARGNTLFGILLDQTKRNELVIFCEKQ